jgi:hypothetical protein
MEPKTLIARELTPAAKSIRNRPEDVLISLADGVTQSATPAPQQTQSMPQKPQGPDLDEIVEKTWSALMQRFTIEHERRGFGRWS